MRGSTASRATGGTTSSRNAASRRARTWLGPAAPVCERPRIHALAGGERRCAQTTAGPGDDSHRPDCSVFACHRCGVVYAAPRRVSANQDGDFAKRCNDCDICSKWAGKDIDWPNGGAYAFGVRFPANFVADDQDHRPPTTCLRAGDRGWNVPWCAPRRSCSARAPRPPSRRRGSVRNGARDRPPGCLG